MPATSVKELIDHAKTKPQQVSYASNGNAAASHVAGELLRTLGGFSWIRVPYKGAGPAITDVVGGHVQFLIGAISTSLPHVRAGKIRSIAFTRSGAFERGSRSADGNELAMWAKVFKEAGIRLKLTLAPIRDCCDLAV